VELIILFAVLLVFMFFTSRKARRQQQEKLDFQGSLAPGQRVVTASGVVGTVTGVEGDIITLEHAPGSTTTWLRAAIARPYEEPAEAEPEEAAGTDEDGPIPGIIEKD